MPKTYANNYNGLRTAIEASTDLALKAIRKQVRENTAEVMAQRINHDSRKPNNPSLLAFALTTIKPHAFDTLKILLSIEGVDVVNRTKQQGLTPLQILQTIAHLSQTQKHELFGLMVQRGLTGTSPFASAPVQVVPPPEDLTSSPIAPPNTPMPSNGFKDESDTDTVTAQAASELDDADTLATQEESEQDDAASFATQDQDESEEEEYNAAQEWDVLDDWLDQQDSVATEENGYMIIQPPAAPGAILAGLGSTTGRTSPTGHVELLSTTASQQMSYSNND